MLVRPSIILFCMCTLSVLYHILHECVLLSVTMCVTMSVVVLLRCCSALWIGVLVLHAAVRLWGNMQWKRDKAGPKMCVLLGPALGEPQRHMDLRVCNDSMSQLFGRPSWEEAGSVLQSVAL